MLPLPDTITSCCSCGHTIAAQTIDGDPPPEHPVMTSYIECPKCEGTMSAIQIDIEQYSKIQEMLMVAFINFLQGDVYSE